PWRPGLGADDDTGGGAHLAVPHGASAGVAVIGGHSRNAVRRMVREIERVDAVLGRRHEEEVLGDTRRDRNPFDIERIGQRLAVDPPFVDPLEMPRHAPWGENGLGQDGAGARVVHPLGGDAGRSAGQEACEKSRNPESGRHAWKVAGCSSSVKEAPFLFGESSPRSNKSSLRLNETSLRLDETSLWLEETSLRLEETSLQLDETSLWLDETSLRLEETSLRLEETSLQLEETSLRLEETSLRLDSLSGQGPSAASDAVARDLPTCRITSARASQPSRRDKGSPAQDFNPGCGAVAQPSFQWPAVPRLAGEALPRAPGREPQHAPDSCRPPSASRNQSSGVL